MAMKWMWRMEMSQKKLANYIVDSEGFGGAELMAVKVKEVVAMNKLVRLRELAAVECGTMVGIQPIIGN